MFPSESGCLSHFRVAFYVTKDRLSNEPHSDYGQGKGQGHFQAQMYKMYISDIVS